MESRIRALDGHTVNQIAAGEVVERPSSVVKELVENSLDAGATRIEVHVEQAGRSLIRVLDNGIGMSPIDARLAFERHATSKIQSVDDLQALHSLGFRGEAVPSIASVSRMTLKTAAEDGPRTVISSEGGQLRELRPESGPKGTEFTVEDLFFNTPARLKFLKSDTTELGQMVDVVGRYAMAYPDVSFLLTHNGQEAIRTTGDGDTLNAIAEVWGRDLARALAEVRTELGGLHVTGFISPPHVTKPNRAYQTVFVNGRPVRTRTLTTALDVAYRDITPERRYPVLFLKIEIDPDLVDVNVSPTKTEVKFQREGAAFEALRIAIKQSLLEHGMMPSVRAVSDTNEAIRQSEAAMAQAWAPTLLQAPLPASGAVADLGLVMATDDPFVTTPSINTSRFPFADLLRGLKVIGQAMNTYIVAETERGIVLIDQHVAHERILYEYLCGLKRSSLVEKQPLLVPLQLTLDKRAAILIRDRLDELEAVGFDLEPFGGESYVVRAVPAAVRSRDPLRILRDMIDELVESSVARRLVPTREQIWITTSCKLAVKAGDPLGMAEMERLIVDLAETENPYLCPHGRPITLTFTNDELLRRFKRT